jgi:acetylornithine deacetylase
VNDPTIRLLADLVAIDSVNPALVPGAAGEAAMADRVVAELRRLGLDVTAHEAAPGRPNVVGVLEGRGPGRTLMLCGHLDTVGVAGMEAPFDPVQRDGRLFGRGAQDMKGGLAAMLGALRELSAEGLPAGRVVLAAVADEEHGSLGADALVRDWQADGAVVGEPTDLEIAVAHKGFAWVEVATRGRAAHGSRPREGRDAILHMGRALARLERLDRELQGRPPHPLLGTASLHASLIAGGREMSTYPDACSLQLERRTLVGEPSGIALAEVEATLAVLADEDAAFEASARLLMERPPYATPEGHPLPALIEAALARRGLSRRRSAASFWTDAAILGGAGTPSVVFGPGGAGLHSVEEHVRTDDVLVCQDVLAELARRFCAGELA